MRYRALLLAAGLGTRLRPLTNTIPKCLIEIGGKPILESWLSRLEASDCEGALINTHYKYKQVRKYISDRNNSQMLVRESYEEKLLGTAKTLLLNREFFQKANTIGVLIHADNATELNMKDLIKAHLERPKHCALTMLTFNADRPENCGVVVCDKHDVMVEFHEKRPNPPGNKANGAVYVFDPTFLDELMEWGSNACDFSTEILPNMIGRVFTWHTGNAYIDIGTPENLAKARRIWPKTI